jgi:hypothetical protein
LPRHPTSKTMRNHPYTRSLNGLTCYSEYRTARGARGGVGKEAEGGEG